MRGFQTKGILLSILVSVAASLGGARETFAGPMDFLFQRAMRMQAKKMRPLEFSEQKRIVTEGAFDQRINFKEAGDARTFKQRYYLDASNATDENSPVFYYICGEATCSSDEMDGIATDLAAQNHGYVISLEHRYYGKSQPFDKLSAENMQFLSVEYALNDLATFQLYAKEKLGLKGKWVVIGGSYAGALSAFYRLKHPELVVGALASSAPVQAMANFENYDLTVDRVAGPECAAKLRAATAEIESALQDKTKAAEVKAKFGGEMIRDDVDFIYVVADMAAFAVQYGYRDQFCDTLVNSTQLVDDYARIGKNLFARFGITALTDSYQGSESENPDDYYKTFGSRQWMYQSCQEFGYYQVAYHDPAHSTRSARITLAYHDSVCDRLYKIKTPVNTDATNQTYYQDLLDPTKAQNIFYTNGSTDPWAELSITKEKANDINPLTNVLTIAGASHCKDLGRSTNPAVVAAQDQLKSLVTSWLK